ncbi:hypothetical protein P0Y35_18165 [Kiritimatiellaeota bacterium B1221]|nr:hypothetical protein [Kiritimatiellaeota bacterium B1221]
MHDRIEREGIPGDLRFKLPCRDLGKLRNLGWIPMIGAVVLFVMAYHWGYDLALELWQDLPRNGSEIGVKDLLPALFLIPSLIMIFLGVKLLLTGWVLIGNRTWTEVGVTHTHLRVKDHLGPWKKKRKFPIQSITGLSMVEGFGDPAESADVPDKLSDMVPADLWSLLLYQGEGKERLLCLAYPQRVINELSQHLAAQLPGVSNVEIYVEEVEAAESKGDSQAFKIPEVPAGSKIIRQDLSDGVAFQVPKMGLGKGSHGLFTLGCIFFSFPLFFLAVILMSEGKETGFTLLLPFLVLSVFFLAGGFMIYFGLSSGTRKVLLKANRRSLRIESTSIFGKKEREWRAGEIVSLKISETGTTVGDTALTGLYVESKEGKTSAWLKMLSRKEQEWIMAHLKQSLGMSE